MKKFILRDSDIRRRAADEVLATPIDDERPMTVTVKEAGRTLEQNSMLWPLLSGFAEQLQWPINGVMVFMDEESWKDVLTAGFKKETVRVAMGMDGGMVMLGLRTSKMLKKEFSEFIEYILAMGALRGVDFERKKLKAAA